MTSIKRLIRASVDKLLCHPQFIAWVTKEQPNAGEVVTINNSFVYRVDSTKTNKSDYLLALKYKGYGQFQKGLFVASGKRSTTTLDCGTQKSRPA